MVKSKEVGKKPHLWSPVRGYTYEETVWSRLRTRDNSVRVVRQLGAVKDVYITDVLPSPSFVVYVQIHNIITNCVRLVVDAEFDVVTAGSEDVTDAAVP